MPASPTARMRPIIPEREKRTEAEGRKAGRACRDFPLITSSSSSRGGGSWRCGILGIAATSFVIYDVPHKGGGPRIDRWLTGLCNINRGLPNLAKSFTTAVPSKGPSERAPPGDPDFPKCAHCSGNRLSEDQGHWEIMSTPPAG